MHGVNLAVVASRRSGRHQHLQTAAHPRTPGKRMFAWQMASEFIVVDAIRRQGDQVARQVCKATYGTLQPSPGVPGRLSEQFAGAQARSDLQVSLTRWQPYAGSFGSSPSPFIDWNRCLLEPQQNHIRSPR